MSSFVIVISSIHWNGMSWRFYLIINFCKHSVFHYTYIEFYYSAANYSIIKWAFLVNLSMHRIFISKNPKKTGSDNRKKFTWADSLDLVFVRFFERFLPGNIFLFHINQDGFCITGLCILMLVFLIVFKWFLYLRRLRISNHFGLSVILSLHKIEHISFTISRTTCITPLVLHLRLSSLNLFLCQLYQVSLMRQQYHTDYIHTQLILHFLIKL